MDIAENSAEYASIGFSIEVDPTHRQSVKAANVRMAPMTMMNLSLCLFLVLWDWSSP